MSTPPAARSYEPVRPASEGRGIRLAGLLVISGFVVNAIFTMFHPSGSADDHPAIFTEYADSDAWEVVHLGQFVGILVALGGLLVLYRILRERGQASPLAMFAAAATVLTAAAFAILQAVDAVALKQAVDAWVGSSGAEEASRFENAETVRWIEWGVQSYFRVLLGLTLALWGATILSTRLLAAWLGWVAVAGGAVSIALGINVGFAGLESGFADVFDPVFQLSVLVFAVGMLLAGRRARQSSSSAA